MKKASQAASKLQGFTHQPLDQHTNSIRLLRITADCRGQPTRLELKHATTESEYVCLSYMWGYEATEIYPVQVNECQLLVRKNLNDFLQVVRKLNISDWLWIDAICINQRDIAERNHQVQQMADIYHRAKHVLVFPEVLGRRTYWMIVMIDRLAPRSMLQNQDGRDVLQHWEMHFLKRNKLKPNAFLPLWYSTITKQIISRLVGTEYFKRMWVLQELLLAPEKYIVSRGGLLPCIMLEQMVMRTNIKYRTAWTASRILFFNSERHRDRNEELLFLSSLLLCMDARDHVYALLGLLEPRPAVQVDYGMTTQELLVDVLLKFPDMEFGPVHLASYLALCMDLRSTTICGTCTAAQDLVCFNRKKQDSRLHDEDTCDIDRPPYDTALQKSRILIYCFSNDLELKRFAGQPSSSYALRCSLCEADLMSPIRQPYSMNAVSLRLPSSHFIGDINSEFQVLKGVQLEKEYVAKDE
jgi:hypothetical protein